MTEKRRGYQPEGPTPQNLDPPTNEPEIHAEEVREMVQEVAEFVGPYCLHLQRPSFLILTERIEALTRAVEAVKKDVDQQYHIINKAVNHLIRVEEIGAKLGEIEEKLLTVLERTGNLGTLTFKISPDLDQLAKDVVDKIKCQFSTLDGPPEVIPEK